MSYSGQSVNRVRGHLTPLGWENAFFKVNSALLHLDTHQTAIEDAQLQAFQRVQVKVLSQQTAELDALNRLGFRLVEGEAELVLGINTAGRPDGIRIAKKEHIPALREAASEAFAYSRFRSPWYQPGDSGRFYAQWVENAVLGTFDHQCLLAVNAPGDLQGFVSLRELSDGSARIGLLATLPHAQGLGVGQRMVAAAIDWCRARRLNRLHVATQMGNLPALRLYLRCGGVIERTAYWLYR
ncbi:dTDP-4-amino-4,6-dideoxy-D-galactose acyltransferase [Erwinia psidii]|uniref:dTDP-4-amino-4,6-dideoxy-D-galactose acyltransferase n=1 Tax=Erwinia psidii TaxID=69224 RepID=UPI00226B44F8|nr:dTDP-4-amino-4,6-dideoxy-D-galactose acyltransferase [Erwinia psidii]MCX8959016.1 dTDP-4-amino-4,6-dideoxy-D-galactose acyltransferase [Erwinia psidii]MCX8962784.1 dTDP-4-amino-4,6-dideoxy-D-galactose acyltransferase [Erwinia psidii]MCX8966102.1 dTDP-4-amino-4,6-dideoxy-D-galactose acyltransferase [Erwinia psidii]